MKKKVYDHDNCGFAVIRTLTEGVVTQFFPQESRRYGFVKAKNGASIFFHIDLGRFMGPFGVKNAEWVPRFEVDTVNDDYIRDPKPGDQLVFLTRQEKKGLVASEWSTLKRYEEALIECGEFAAREEIRIMTNPRYRGYPTPEYAQRWKKRYFEEKREGFNLVFSP